MRLVSSTLLCLCICSLLPNAVDAGLRLTTPGDTAFAVSALAGGTTAAVTISIANDGLAGANSLNRFTIALRIRTDDLAATNVTETDVSIVSVGYPSGDDPVFAMGIQEGTPTQTDLNSGVQALRAEQFQGTNASEDAGGTPGIADNEAIGAGEIDNALTLAFQLSGVAGGVYNVFGVQFPSSQYTQDLGLGNIFSPVAFSNLPTAGSEFLLGQVTVTAPAAVPEPGSVTLVCAALAFGGAYRWRSSRAKKKSAQVSATA